jgi:hypothetical protein
MPGTLPEDVPEASYKALDEVCDNASGLKRACKGHNG